MTVSTHFNQYSIIIASESLTQHQHNIVKHVNTTL